MGIITMFKAARPSSTLLSGLDNFGLPYFAIAVGLNVLLSLTISARLLSQNWRARTSMLESSLTFLYRNATILLIESCSVYAIVSIMFIGPYSANSYAWAIFLPVLAQVQVSTGWCFRTSPPDESYTQVIAPFLVILRIANMKSVEHTAASNAGGICRPGSRAWVLHDPNDGAVHALPLHSLENSQHDHDIKKPHLLV
jgi:hypothetical protein